MATTESNPSIVSLREPSEHEDELTTLMEKYIRVTQLQISLQKRIQALLKEREEDAKAKEEAARLIWEDAKTDSRNVEEANEAVKIKMTQIGEMCREFGNQYDKDAVVETMNKLKELTIVPHAQQPLIPVQKNTGVGIVENNDETTLVKPENILTVEPPKPQTTTTLPNEIASTHVPPPKIKSFVFGVSTGYLNGTTTNTDPSANVNRRRKVMTNITTTKANPNSRPFTFVSITGTPLRVFGSGTITTTTQQNPQNTASIVHPSIFGQPPPEVIQPVTFSSLFGSSTPAKSEDHQPPELSHEAKPNNP